MVVVVKNTIIINNSGKKTIYTNGKDEKGYYDGQISGTFTGFKPGDFKNFGEFLKTKKDRQKFMDDNKKTIDRIEKERIVKELERMQRERDLQTIQQRVSRGDSYSDIGRDMYTGKGQAFEKQSGGVSGKGTKNERNYGGRKDGGLMYADGGRVYLYNRLK